jgi:hypothetical protein
MRTDTNPVTSQAPERLPSRLLIVALTVVVVLADLGTWFLFSLGCGIGENGDPVTTLCVRNDTTAWLLLPLGGAAVAVIAAVLARPLRSYTVLAAGLAFGLACGAAIWVIGIAGS